MKLFEQIFNDGFSMSRQDVKNYILDLPMSFGEEISDRDYEKLDSKFGKDVLSNFPGSASRIAEDYGLSCSGDTVEGFFEFVKDLDSDQIDEVVSHII